MVATERRKILLIRLAVIVVVIGVLWAGYHFLIGSRTITTDNAYVQGQNAMARRSSAGRCWRFPLSRRRS